MLDKSKVPDKAVAKLDMRFKDMADYESLRPKVEAIASDLGLEVSTMANALPIKIDLKNPYIEQFIQLAEQISGHTVEPCHSLGSSDAHHFVSRGIPTILMRPGGGGPHSDNEWLLEEDFVKYYSLIKEYVLQTARL